MQEVGIIACTGACTVPVDRDSGSIGGPRHQNERSVIGIFLSGSVPAAALA